MLSSREYFGGIYATSSLLSIDRMLKGSIPRAPSVVSLPLLVDVRGDGVQINIGERITKKKAIAHFTIISYITVPINKRWVEAPLPVRAT